MHYGFTTEEIDARATLHDRLRKSVPDMHRLPNALDSSLWSALTADGWLEIACSQQQGLSLPGALAVMEEFGRALPGVPWIPSIGMLAPLLAGTECDSARQLLNRLRAGEVVALADCTDSGGHASTLSVRLEGADLILRGEVCAVQFLAEAVAAVLIVERDGRRSRIIVESDTPGVTPVAACSADLSRPYGSWSLSDVRVPSENVLPDCDERGWSALESTLSLTYSAEALGGLAAVLERTVDYVRARKQFGVPVGSFQAVKHNLAELSRALHNGRALMYLAACEVEAGEVGAEVDVVYARLASAASYRRGCETAIQMHGGIGFTWEGGVHYWYRNALANQFQPKSIDHIRSGLRAELLTQHEHPAT